MQEKIPDDFSLEAATATVQHTRISLIQLIIFVHQKDDCYDSDFGSFLLFLKYQSDPHANRN